MLEPLKSPRHPSSSYMLPPSPPSHQKKKKTSIPTTLLTLQKQKPIIPPKRPLLQQSIILIHIKLTESSWTSSSASREAGAWPSALFCPLSPILSPRVRPRFEPIPPERARWVYFRRLDAADARCAVETLPDAGKEAAFGVDAGWGAASGYRFDEKGGCTCIWGAAPPLGRFLFSFFWSSEEMDEYPSPERSPVRLLRGGGRFFFSFVGSFCIWPVLEFVGCVWCFMMVLMGDWWHRTCMCECIFKLTPGFSFWSNTYIIISNIHTTSDKCVRMTLI